MNLFRDDFVESLLSYLHPAPQNFASKNVFKHCTDRTKQSCGAFFGGEPSTPVLCSIFWRLAITCSRPESLTPQLHIYQRELYPLPNVSLPILLRAIYEPTNVFLPAQGLVHLWYCANNIINQSCYPLFSCGHATL